MYVLQKLQVEDIGKRGHYPTRYLAEDYHINRPLVLSLNIYINYD